MIKKATLISTFLISIFHFGQNIGINTTTPTRSLDIDGNMIVTQLNDKTNISNYKKLLTSNETTGDVDYITFPALDQSETKSVEISKNIYISNTALNTKTCSCGDFTFYINSDNKAYIKLNNLNIFNDLTQKQTPTTTPPVTSFKISYGTKSWSPSYNYRNITDKTFTTTNFNTYQELDNIAFPSANTSDIRIYSIVPPKQNNLYRITLTKTLNSANTSQYGLICEKFYIQEIQ